MFFLQELEEARADEERASERAAAAEVRLCTL